MKFQLIPRLRCIGGSSSFRAKSRPWSGGSHVETGMAVQRSKCEGTDSKDQIEIHIRR